MRRNNLTIHIQFFLGLVGLELGRGHTSSQEGPGILCPTFTTSFWPGFPGQCCRSVGGSPVVPQVAGFAEMGPRYLFRTATVASLLIWAASREVSRLCGRLAYWNPDNKCCRSCLQRFGPPACPGEH